LSFWLEHHAAIFHDLASVSGTKVRVPVNSARELLTLSSFLPFCFDLVVFSPALAWPTCDVSIREPCCEFALSHTGHDHVYVSGSVMELFAWLLVARPLLEQGRVSFLPIIGKTPHRWEDPAGSSDARGDHLKQGWLGSDPLRSAAEAFCADILVSLRLGCMHVMSWPDVPLVALSPASVLPGFGDARRHAFLRIHVPHFVQLELPDVASLLSSHVVRDFRTAIETARSLVIDLLRQPKSVEGQTHKIESEVLNPASEMLRRVLAESMQSHSLNTESRWIEIVVEVSTEEEGIPADVKRAEVGDALNALRAMDQTVSTQVSVPKNSILHGVGCSL
jgi:hypothetical protein